MALRDWLLLVPFVGFGVVANMLIKTGLNHLHLGSLVSAKGIVALLSSPWVMCGIFCYGMGLATYLYLLNRLPLNLVQPFSALAFVGVILASRFVLGEAISTVRWAGIILIFAGIIMVGRSL